MNLIPAGSGQWDGLIVLCAANGYDGVRMADWHMARHLSRLAPVLYVDPPVSPVRIARRRAPLRLPWLRLERPGLARLTPLVEPFPGRRATAGLTSGLARAYLRRATARLGGRSRGLISSWPQYPVFGSCAEQVTVYWARDDFVGGARLLGLNPGLLDARERRVAASADIVVAATPGVAATWHDRGLEPVLVPYGTDAAAYRDVDLAPVPGDARLPGPVAGFIGRINERTDLRLLEEIAARGRSLLLVGPKDPAFARHRFEALQRRGNVRWVGPKPSGALPGYLRAMDVGLVPYRDSAFNRGSFPLKTLEYLAAGRAVVATDLPAIRWLASDLISVASSPADFADAVDRQLAQGRTPAAAARRREFAAPHSWQLRAARLFEVITSRVPEPRAPAPEMLAGGCSRILGACHDRPGDNDILRHQEIIE